STVWDYDADGRLSQAADSLGHWRAFEYDASGKAAVFTDSSGAWLRRRHDAVGRVVEQWNQDGMLQRTVYDAAGRPAMQGSGLVLTPENLDQPPAVLTFPQVCQFLYDVGGNQTAMITLSGGVIERVPLGNGLFTCQALFPGQEESRRQFQYDLAGRMVAEESAMGLRQVYQRDAAGQITALTSPGGGRWLCSYGQLGEVLSTTDPLGHVTRFEYDRRGLPAARINPDGGRWDFVFDAQGRMVAEVDPAGHCREIERDAFGQPVRHGLPPLRETTAAGATEATGPAEFVFDYHSGYFLAGVTDPQGRLTTFRRDEFGRVIGEQLPGGQECRIFYDDDGLQPSRYLDFAGHETTYAYLNHKLLLRREHRHALQPDVVRREYDFSYDAGGRLRQIRRRDPGNDQTQTVAMDYDSLGRLNQRRLDDDPGVGYEYDQDDRPIRLEGAMSGLRFDYAEDGLCAGITVARAAGEDIVDAAEKLALTRDLRGLPRRVDFPGGGSAIIEWDGQSRPIAIRHADASGQLLYGWGTVYDVSGRQVASQEDRRLADGRMLQRNRAWRYDAWGRLRHEDSQAPGREWLSYTQEFTYDLSGNRMTVDRQYDNGGFRFRRCQYDVNDRLLSETRTTVDAAQRYDFAWDDNGSLTAMYVRKGGHDSEPPPEMPPTHERQFLWDCENRLTTVVLLDCDGQGRTILEQRTDFTYDPQGLLIGQKYVRTAADGSSFSRETHFVYAGLTVDAVPRLLETVEHRDGVEYERRSYVRSGMVLLIYSSRHGRLRCLTDQAGSVHGLCNGDDPGPDSLNDYDAWGEALPGDGEPAAGPGFAGEWYDPETGLVYLRSRFYWPEFGIFISRDRHPGDPEQPLSLHRYAYCRNDPVNHCDPTGCFGVALAQAAMMSVGGFPLLSYWRGGIEYLSGWFENQAMTLEFAAQEREHDQAAVIVHGLQYHSPGYADDFIDLLKARGIEFDSYQFIWSGCQLAEVMLPPNRIHHGMALASLTHCLAQLPAKGYSRVHVIAHSWGTVLSRDALGRHPLVLSHWVTMGSPLSAGTVPQFPYQAWMNISTRSDPVVHLAPLVCAVGFTDGFMPLYTQKPPPLQIDLGSQAADPHGSYWHDPLSLARIAALLRQ
ncbi:MAG: hypothetical protein PHC30_09285, partial [Lentisphaeria bacterium]|nr:hypothetical protein [Lentisphaeria bacterium]